MLYNFLAKLLPFGLSFFITGMIFLLLQNSKLFIRKKKIVYIIAQIFYTLGIVCTFSPFPVFLAQGVLSALVIFLLTGVFILFISSIIYNVNNPLLISTAFPTLLYAVFSIILAIVLYPQYNIEKTPGNEYKIKDPEIREVVIFNNIPLNANSYKIDIIANQDNDEKKDDYINYWYITDNNDVIYDKVNAYDTTLVPSKDNKYYLEINKYITLTKRASKVGNFSPEITERTVNVFYLPEEIVGISN